MCLQWNVIQQGGKKWLSLETLFLLKQNTDTLFLWKQNADTFIVSTETKCFQSPAVWQCRVMQQEADSLNSPLASSQMSGFGSAIQSCLPLMNFL